MTSNAPGSREDGFVAAALAGATTPSDRPLVTLTFAQTLDCKLASALGQPRLLISGRESMGVTFRCVCT
jgi:2,5-diamino-6-(ribosylamino)-4(3H)-pyrimidinone 5'-phosphate reductase